MRRFCVAFVKVPTTLAQWAAPKKELVFIVTEVKEERNIEEEGKPTDDILELVKDSADAISKVGVLAAVCSQELAESSQLFHRNIGLHSYDLA